MVHWKQMRHRELTLRSNLFVCLSFDFVYVYPIIIILPWPTKLLEYSVSVCVCTVVHAFSIKKHYICKSTVILASHFWSRLKSSKRKWEWNWHKEGRMRRNKLLKNRLTCSKFKYFFHVFVKITETKYKNL